MAFPLHQTHRLWHPSASVNGVGRMLLRLMPIGGSVTYGQGSSDGNGYRNRLLELLLSNGYNVEMVGSRKAGLMKHNENEGWRGFRIDQILNKAQKSVPARLPNVFTLNAGSNDCVQNFKVENSGERLDSLLEYLWSSSPGSTIILSTLLMNADPRTEQHVLRVNEQFQKLAEKLTNEQRRIVLVDMHGDDGPQLDQLCDGTHPNDAGYDMMARIWYEGVKSAVSKGYLQPPALLPQNATSQG